MPIFTTITDHRMVADIRLLTTAIAADTDWKATHLVGIGRGGLVPAVYLSHALGLPMLSIDYSAQAGELALEAITRLARRTRNGDRLIFVDDINDSGRTIGHLREWLAREGSEMASVRFATLIDNTRSLQRVDHAARTIDRAVMKDWFVFPWEAMAASDAIAADADALPERIA